MTVRVYKSVAPSIRLYGAHEESIEAETVNEFCHATFTPTAGAVIVVPIGSVEQVQFEAGSTPSSYIPTSGSQVTRAAETLVLPPENALTLGPNLANTTSTTKTTTGSVTSWSEAPVVGKMYLLEYEVSESTWTGDVYQEPSQGPFTYQVHSKEVGSHSYTLVAEDTSSWSALQLGGASPTGSITFSNISIREIVMPDALSIAMEGTMTYADTGNFREVSFVRWSESVSNEIELRLNTAGGFSGMMQFIQDAGSEVALNAVGAYSPGINVPFSIASRHGATFVNGAVDGTALTANETPTALPDLSATDLELGYEFMGTIRNFRLWEDDIGDTGLEEATE